SIPANQLFMQYAVIVQQVSGNRYLTGFTNEFFNPFKDSQSGTKTYCVDLQQISTRRIFIPIKDAFFHTPTINKFPTMQEKRGYCNEGFDGCDNYKHDGVCRCH